MSNVSKITDKWFQMGRKIKINKIYCEIYKNYNENSDLGYFLEVDIDYPTELFNIHKELPLNGKKLINVKKLFVVQKTKKNVVRIRALKQALNNGLIQKYRYEY